MHQSGNDVGSRESCGHQRMKKLHFLNKQVSPGVRDISLMRLHDFLSSFIVLFYSPQSKNFEHQRNYELPVGKNH